MIEISKSTIDNWYSYNPVTGGFSRTKKQGSRSAGSAAGWKAKNGYIYLYLGRAQHLAHRLAWVSYYGSHPDQWIDHIDGDRANNRISSLRLASVSSNLSNRGATVKNKSGFKGVSWCKPAKKWRAQIMVNCKNKHLGVFDTPELAALAYDAASAANFGEFAYLNFPEQRA